jgi:predicted amidohydrolase YtcJ
MIIRLCAALGLLFLFSCNNKTEVDLLIHHAVIYTTDSAFTIAEALAVKDGRIVATGSNTDIQGQYEAKQTINAKGRAVYPGFIDAHAHFYGYGKTLQQADLVGTKTWQEVLERTQTFAAGYKGEWIYGRGWDQNDWPEKQYPNKTMLDSLFGNKPVVLERIDGHAAIANQAALDKAGIKAGQTLTGGAIETKAGQLTGILIDNAVDLVANVMPATTKAQMEQSLRMAQDKCFAAGLTTVDDCGLMYDVVDIIKAMQEKGELKMRLYVMLTDSSVNYDKYLAKGPLKTDRLNVRAFKVYGDGALGSRGACLLQPYSDKPGWHGFLLRNRTHYEAIAARLANTDFQMCTHAIGDSGNRMVLQTYAQVLKGKNDKRWRIEHAQVVNLNDIKWFADYSIIPSVQPTHATSDMYWAKDRVGAERMKGAYAYKQLLQQNGWLPLGTDFPVEDISPIKTFYAAVVRQDAQGFPDGGFQPGDALTREEALRGMTIWAARSNFEEKEKGSLEKGKFADFVILDRDIMKIDAKELLNVKVMSTFCNGEMVYDVTK